MHRTWASLTVLAGCCLAGLIAWLNSARALPDKPDESTPPRFNVPVTHVVLFNTGVAYFQRQANVEGKQRLELTFPMGDLNDLLKSMTVDDGGQPGTIGYDGADPVEQALKSFAVDLTGNPTMGQILNQSRGEKVEVTFEAQPGAAAPLTGTIVGMEANGSGDKETHSLNLLCVDGLRRVPLERVQRVRFLDSEREREFRRALGMLASGNGGQRRRVWAELKGAGKREVKIGYVLEAPIWKATYRLNLSDKPTIEARAVIENATEDDWKDVKVTLVAGRPITFAMDLSKPLFVPRPPQQPEFYASLQPPDYGTSTRLAGMGFGQLGGNLGIQIGGQFGIMGGMPPMPVVTGQTMPFASLGSMLNRYQIPPTTIETPRLTYDNLIQRRTELLAEREQKKADAKAAGQTMADALEDIALTADRIGDGFRRTVESKVSLPRQTSAMVPLMREPVEVTRFSVYNRDVHPRFPMSTLKVKNTTGQPLPQGPVSVNDAGAFVGDCKLPDMAPGDERLVSYAVDLGVEVRVERGDIEPKRPDVWLQRGTLVIVPLSRRLTFVGMMNRSKSARDIVFEHPREEGWSPFGKVMPEDTTTHHRRYRFAAPAGETTRSVIEEEWRLKQETKPVGTVAPAMWAALLKEELPPAVRTAVEKIIALRDAVDTATKAAAELRTQRDALDTEQRRLKERIDKLPEASAARKRLSEEYETQDKALEKLTTQVRERVEAQAKAERERDAYFAEVSAK